MLGVLEPLAALTLLVNAVLPYALNSYIYG